MTYAGIPSFFSLGMEDGHVPTFWKNADFTLRDTSRLRPSIHSGRGVGNYRNLNRSPGALPAQASKKAPLPPLKVGGCSATHPDLDFRIVEFCLILVRGISAQ